jgi:hypothetical protein
VKGFDEYFALFGQKRAIFLPDVMGFDEYFALFGLKRAHC